jgi:hypothetical protein
VTNDRYLLQTVAIDVIFSLNFAAILYLSYIHLGSSVCHPVVLSYSCRPVCRSCGTLSYSLCFSNQTDQGDETEGCERERLEMDR